MRTYKKQFEQKEREIIDSLLSRLYELEYPTGPSRYYGYELRMCLFSGALGGSLIVASALMEMYIRGLIIYYSENAQSESKQKLDVEYLLEQNRDLNFKKMLETLVQFGLFNEEDSVELSAIYREVRIPTHHGLSQRLINTGSDSLFEGLKKLFNIRLNVSLSDFESYFELNSLTIIEKILDALERNQPGAYVYA